MTAALKRAFLKALPPVPEPPSKRAASAYALFMQAKAKALFPAHADTEKATDRLAAVSAQVSAEWKALSPQDKQVWESLKSRHQEAYDSAYRAYLQARSPRDVWIEMTKYRLLKALSKSPSKRIPKPPPHSQAPKRPLSAALAFAVDMHGLPAAEQERLLGSALAGKPLGERTKLIFNAYKSLSPSEKQVSLFVPPSKNKLYLPPPLTLKSNFFF